MSQPKFKYTCIDAKSVRSLCWWGDTLVDWAAGYSIELDGSVQRVAGFDTSYPFDAACISPSGEYAVVYARRGTKGVVLREGSVVREINRSYYHANAYEYPIVLFAGPNGQELIAHCPDNYCQIEIDELGSGQRLTARNVGKPTYFFHSRLQVNRSGSHLLSAGWIWHPWDSVAIFDIVDCLTEPARLDVYGVGPYFDAEVSSAVFSNDRSILVATSAEDARDDEDRADPLGPLCLGVYDLSVSGYSTIVRVGEIVGQMMPLANELVVGFYEHPKLISLRTGQILHRWADLDGGKQESSIIHAAGKLPPLACDPARSRFAVASESGIAVVEIDPSSFDH